MMMAESKANATEKSHHMTVGQHLVSGRREKQTLLKNFGGVFFSDSVNLKHTLDSVAKISNQTQLNSTTFNSKQAARPSQKKQRLQSARLSQLPQKPPIADSTNRKQQLASQRVGGISVKTKRELDQHRVKGERITQFEAQGGSSSQVALLGARKKQFGLKKSLSTFKNTRNSDLKNLQAQQQADNRLSNYETEDAATRQRTRQIQSAQSSEALKKPLGAMTQGVLGGKYGIRGRDSKESSMSHLVKSNPESIKDGSNLNYLRRARNSEGGGQIDSSNPSNSLAHAGVFVEDQFLQRPLNSNLRKRPISAKETNPLHSQLPPKRFLGKSKQQPSQRRAPSNQLRHKGANGPSSSLNGRTIHGQSKQALSKGGGNFIYNSTSNNIEMFVGEASQNQKPKKAMSRQEALPAFINIQSRHMLEQQDQTALSRSHESSKKVEMLDSEPEEPIEEDIVCQEEDGLQQKKDSPLSGRENEYGMVRNGCNRNLPQMIMDTDATAKTQPVNQETVHNIGKIQRNPGPIRVESYEGYETVEQYQADQQTGIEEPKAKQEQPLTYHDIRQEELREAIDRKKVMTDEEYKVARLTGFSKNTCGSANSLEYSPSPKRDTGAAQQSPNESPIPVKHDKTDSLILQSEFQQVQSAPNSANMQMPQSAETSGHLAQTKQTQQDIMQKMEGFPQECDFSPEVRVCDEMGNLSLNDLSPKGELAMTTQYVDQNKDLHQDLEGQYTIDSAAEILQTKRPGRRYRLKSARSENKIGPSQASQIPQNRLQNRASRQQLHSGTDVPKNQMFLAQSQEDKYHKLYQQGESQMDAHLNKLANEMQLNWSGQPTIATELQSHEYDLKQYLPPSTKLRPRDYKPSHLRFHRLSQGSSTHFKLGGFTAASQKSRSPKNRRKLMYTSEQRETEPQMYEQSYQQYFQGTKASKPQRIRSALPASRRPTKQVGSGMQTDNSTDNLQLIPQIHSQKQIGISVEQADEFSVMSHSGKAKSFSMKHPRGWIPGGKFNQTSKTSLNQQQLQGSSMSKMNSTISQRKQRKSGSRKPKQRFEDEAEEAKYKNYLKHVRMLNKMKEYLSAMHKSMSKDVIKRLVVAIKRMEQDLAFYENNWHMFQSPNLDYAQGFLDLELDSTQQVEETSQVMHDSASRGTLNYPQIIKEGEPYLSFKDNNKNYRTPMAESPTFSNMDERKVNQKRTKRYQH